MAASARRPRAGSAGRATGKGPRRAGAARKAPARRATATRRAAGAAAKRPRAPSTKKRASPRRRVARRPRPQPRSDFVIVEDNLGFDPQKENAERRAYLEEARSQDVSD